MEKMLITTLDRNGTTWRSCSPLPKTRAERKHHGEDVNHYLRQELNESIMEKTLILPQRLLNGGGQVLELGQMQRCEGLALVRHVLAQLRGQKLLLVLVPAKVVEQHLKSAGCLQTAGER